jgi:glutamate-ammonia-ligase adenylyltransferase
LTVTTRRGRLYDVDLRLRPSGRKGPVATQFSSFVLYQSKEAQSWEHLALARARVIAGDVSLASEIEAARTSILSRPPSATLRREIAEMRALIAQEKAPRGPFDLKYADGGLVDVDFLAQYFCLAHAHENARMLATHPMEQLAAARAAGYLSAETADTLLAARQLYTDITQLLQTLVAADAAVAPVSGVVAKRLANAAGLPDLPRLEADVSEARGRVRAIFAAIIG